MKLKRFFPAFVLLSILILFLSNNAYAVMGMNYPGTRARAMGSAFTAVADDASAIWYNPAGLAIGQKGTQIDIILEGSETIPFNTDPTVDPGTEFKPFAAIKGKFNNFGMALSYYTPYTYDGIYLDNNVGLEQLDIVSLGAAYALPWNIKVGGTVEYVFLNNEDNVDLDNDEDFSGSVGIHWTPVDIVDKGIVVAVGGTYRFQSEMDNDVYFAEKPESWNLGAAVTKSITPLRSRLTLSAQYEETDFTDAWQSGIGEAAQDLTYEMTSVGAEWQIDLQGDTITRILLRAGMYNEDASERGDWEMDGITAGIGLNIKDNWALEYAFEKRDYGFDDDILHSVALTFSYTKTEN